MEPFYNVASVGAEPLEGITDPRPCTLTGIAKFDTIDSEYCVYNEYVALRLGRLFNVPLADGVLSIIDNDISYVSLELFSPDISLLEPLPSQYPKIAMRYSYEAAALVAYDILIGNYDRHSNFRATLVNNPMLRAFDHSHCLLTVEGDHMKSLQRLASDELLVKFHPFFGLVDYEKLKSWTNRVARIDRTLIWRCCYMMRPFKNVSVELQEMLTEVLTQRCGNLQDIIEANRDKICLQP